MKAVRTDSVFDTVDAHTRTHKPYVLYIIIYVFTPFLYSSAFSNKSRPSTYNLVLFFYTKFVECVCECERDFNVNDKDTLIGRDWKADILNKQNFDGRK